jgi:NADH:ubiquinone oxidoreductase subunit 4 (subunit M)
VQPELALKAISHFTIGISLIAILFALLVSLRKELSGEEAFRGIVHLGFVVLGICTFVALMAAYFQARKIIVPASFSLRLDTAAVSQQESAR